MSAQPVSQPVSQPVTVARPAAGPARLPALLTEPVHERGSALWRFHCALDDLVSVTAVPAAAALPEPEDVACVLRSLAGGLRQLNPVLGQLEDRLTALATSPNVGLTDPAGFVPPGAGLDAGACRVCGCTEEVACPDGCWWVPDPAGLGELCSSCAAALAGGPAAVLQAVYAVLAVARDGLIVAARGAAAAGGYAACLQLTNPTDPADPVDLADPVDATDPVDAAAAAAGGRGPR